MAEKLTNPLDLPEKGTRELTADDYVYGIKRIGDVRTVSPVLGILSSHIVGLKAFSETFAQALKEAEAADVRRPISGIFPLRA